MLLAAAAYLPVPGLSGIGDRTVNQSRGNLIHDAATLKFGDIQAIRVQDSLVKDIDGAKRMETADLFSR